MDSHALTPASRSDAHVSEAWPPPGHFFSYRVEEKLENRPAISFDFVLPSGPGDGVSMTTVKVGRHGGDTEGDRVFRDDLFTVVGSITVAAGHVEAAMKRLLLVLKGREQMFSLADYTWADLEKHLRTECDGSDERRRALLVALNWSSSLGLRERRHDAVHGSWWIFAGVGARISRWPRKSDGHTIVGELRDFQKLSDDCWRYAQRLDALIANDWPRVMLPAAG